MKISFLYSDVKIGEILYRAKKKNVFTYDADGNILTTDFKIFAKTKYDCLEIESIEVFANICPNIFNAKEMWEIESDVLFN